MIFAKYIVAKFSLEWLLEDDEVRFFANPRAKKNRAKDKIILESREDGLLWYRFTVTGFSWNATITQSLLANSTLVAAIEKKGSKKRKEIRKERKERGGRVWKWSVRPLTSSVTTR